jgi:hypothetical protein
LKSQWIAPTVWFREAVDTALSLLVLFGRSLVDVNARAMIDRPSKTNLDPTFCLLVNEFAMSHRFESADTSPTEAMELTGHSR